jgi:hypothetical protein
VGGGPTGIEWSAELCDMIDEDMKHLYPDLVGYAKVRRNPPQPSPIKHLQPILTLQTPR